MIDRWGAVRWEKCVSLKQPQDDLTLVGLKEDICQHWSPSYYTFILARFLTDFMLWNVATQY